MMARKVLFQAYGMFVEVRDGEGYHNHSESSWNHESPLGPPRTSLADILRDAEYAAAFLEAYPKHSGCSKIHLSSVYTKHVLVDAESGRILLSSSSQQAA